MSRAGAVENMHARWNSVIHATLLMHGVNLGLLGRDETSTTKLPRECHDVIGKLCKELLTEACEAQAKHPRLIAAAERRINAQLWNALKLYSRKEFGQWEQLEIDPYPSPHVTTTRQVQTSAQPNQRGNRP